MRLLIAASALIFAAAPGSAGQRDPVPPATAIGAPLDCVQTNLIRETRVHDGRTIDFVMSGGKIYRNILPGGECPGLAFDRRFLYRTSIGRLCSVDVITVLQAPGLSQGASCGLGKFQPVKLDKAR